MKTTALYDQIGRGYRQHRRPDPRIASAIVNALGDAKTVLNVGAGAGSYEPEDRTVVAVELSAAMIRQRPPDAAPVVQASAMNLPFDNAAFDAATAILTIHHWPDRARGMAEMRRVVKHRCVIVTWEPPATPFWLTAEYFPQILDYDRQQFPPWFRQPEFRCSVATIPIPHDCTDGFLCAYWRRPASYLDPEVRRAISSFSRDIDFDTGLGQLRRDLSGGTWHRRHADLLDMHELDLGYRLVVLHE